MIRVIMSSLSFSSHIRGCTQEAVPPASEQAQSVVTFLPLSIAAF